MRGLSAIVVSFNRHDALLRTLAHLRRCDLIGQIIVVDNASHDSSESAARSFLAEVDGAVVIEMPRNAGVEAFNVGARAATGEFLLVLDDDAFPDPDTLGDALDALRADPSVGAVALAPQHPRDARREWPHASAPTAAFPMMGCGNLVRADAWRRAGGYLTEYFLYRNDADLALSLLALGYRVLFDPAWVVWHDSPHAALKSERWLKLATRNWVWMARRHGRGFWKWAGIALGAAKAFMHAGQDNARAQLVIDGLREGLRTQPPPPAAASGGEYWCRLVKLQLSRAR